MLPPCSDRLAEQRVQLEQELKGLQSPGADPSLRNCQSVWEVHRRLEHRQQVQFDASGIRAQNISQVDHARSSVVIIEIERFARVSIARVAVWHRSE